CTGGGIRWTGPCRRLFRPRRTSAAAPSSADNWVDRRACRRHPVMTKNSFSGQRAGGRGPAYRVGRSDSPVTGAAAGANLADMLTILEAIVGALLVALRPRASLVAEN